MAHLRTYKARWGAVAGRPLPVPDRPASAHRRGNLKTRRASVVLLLPALLWVFTQLVMSGFILQPTIAQAGGLHSITICSGTELTTITVDANGNPVKDIPAKKVSCPWCAQFAGIGPLPAPDLTLVALPDAEAQPLFLAQAQPAATGLSHSPYASRAPPRSTRI